jgi:hypothetical protein
MKMKMTKEQNKLAKELFAPTADPREGKTRLTVRFLMEGDRLSVVRPTMGRRVKVGVVTHYVEKPAVTPTGGRYTKRAMTVKTKDGRKWFGTLKNGSNIVRLRLAENGD